MSDLMKSSIIGALIAGRFILLCFWFTILLSNINSAQIEKLNSAIFKPQIVIQQLLYNSKVSHIIPAVKGVIKGEFPDNLKIVANMIISSW